MTQMTTPRALAALQDAIRADVLDELLEKLQALRAEAADGEQGYLDGIDDAISTLQG